MMPLSPDTIATVAGGALCANAGLGLWLIKQTAEMRERVSRLETLTEHLPCERSTQSPRPSVPHCSPSE
jgi:hypothetical protein